MIESLSRGPMPVIMIEMPEILLRLVIGKDYTLQDLEGILNTICN